jgi:hypothetical protein
MSAKLLLLTGATILSLAVGSVGISAVLPDNPLAEAGVRARRGTRIYGIVESIEETTLALATPVGPVALVTDINTIFRVPDVAGGSLADLAVGDIVGALGWWGEGSDVFHAFAVAKLADDRVFPLAGTLSEIGDDTLIVETGHGPATVRVNGETRYSIRGVEEPGLDDLEVGTKVVVRGALEPDGSLLARLGIGAAQPGPRQGRLRGDVMAIEESTLTIRADRREIVVHTNEATEFRVPGVENPTIVDLKVGDRVAGEGVIEEASTGSGKLVITATLVVVLPEDVARLNGQVTAIEGATLALDTARGPVDVLTDSNTVFRIPGVEEPTLADVKVGDHVTVGGTWENEATFHALGVGVIGGQRAGSRGAVRGRAVSIGEDSLVVGTPRGPVTVLVDDETQFRVPGMEDAGIGDIEEGALVGARGTWNEDGSLQANGIGVMDERGRPIYGR